MWAERVDLVNDYSKEIKRRRTFAIISHPDAGKTTLTEKFIKMGIDELSVSPNMVLPIRNIIVNINAAN